MKLQDAQTLGLSSLEDFVSSDFDALESHMRRCAETRSTTVYLRTAFEMVHAATAGRIVTTCAVFGACALLLLSIA
jgi:hypothetical protein